MKVNASPKRLQRGTSYVSTTIMDPVIYLSYFLKKIPVLAVLETGVWLMAAILSSQSLG